MKSYILAILGIVVLGVMVEIVIPDGKINKFIKSIYAIFVVAVFVSPITTFFANKSNYELNYNNFQINQGFIDYVWQEKTKNTEKQIEDVCSENGLTNVDIKLEYSLESNEIKYISCKANLKNLVILEQGRHINKYEFIRQAVGKITGLGDAEIIFDE